MLRRVLAVVAGATVALAVTPALADNGNGKGADRYIVVLRDGADSASKANEAKAKHQAEVTHVYGTALVGYAAKIPAAQVGKLPSGPDVVAVVPDTPVSLAAQTVPAGIDRIDADLSSTRAGDGAGSVNVGV